MKSWVISAGVPNSDIPVRRSLFVRSALLPAMISNETANGLRTPPEWHNIVIWGELGELVSREFKKGDAIMVRGRHRTRSYESKGQKKQISEIIATEIYRPVYVKKTADSAAYMPEEAPIQEFSDDSLPDADIPF